MRHLLRPLGPVVLAAPLAAQLGQPPVPPGNPITPEKALLGKALFWDEQLSATGTMACGSCHLPRYGGSDGLSAHPELATNPGFDEVFGTEDDVLGSPGVIRNEADGSYQPAPLFGLGRQITRRLAPSTINAAFFADAMFWDGRAGGTFTDPGTGAIALPELAALESQASEPPVSDVEMGHVGIDWDAVAGRVEQVTPLALASEIPPSMNGVLGHTYPQLFAAAFGTPDVTAARISMAIATYERTLVSNQAPIDFFVAGNEEALTPLQREGAIVFDTDGRCFVCHSTQLFSDRDFHNIGLRPAFEDPGRFEVTGDPADMGKFKTPSLRNVSLRPRKFHDGSHGSLLEVIEFYDRGGDFDDNLDPEIVPLGLTSFQMTALAAYLESFTDPRVANETFPFDHPRLFSMSNRVPSLFGQGASGTGGFDPRSIAIEPPYIQNPSFTLGVKDALGGAAGLLGFGIEAFPLGLDLFGIKVYLNPVSASILPVAMEGAGPGGGYASFSASLNARPAAIGTPVFAQWYVLDPGGPGLLSASEAIEMVLF